MRGKTKNMAKKVQQQGIAVEWELYLYLLRCAIRGEKEQEEILKKYLAVDTEWLINTAYKKQQRMLLDSYIVKYNNLKYGKEDTSRIPLEVVMDGYQQYSCIRRILQEAEKNEVELVLFKGCVLADLYPQYIQRVSCDTDILVNRKDKEKAICLFENLGYILKEESSNNEVLVFQNKQYHHKVELHTCLWEDYKGKRLDKLKELGIDDENSFIHIKACGMSITTLGYEEHLIYQLFHIIKHFSLQGISVKYLADITLYVDQYGKYIDFHKFWLKVERLGYGKFAYDFFVLCIQYLGMDDSIIKDYRKDIGSELIFLLNDLLEGGVVYKDKNAKWQILGMMTPYFVGEKTTSSTKLRRKMQVAFPKRKDLPEEYSYAIKIPVLLPVAWIHKLVNYLIKYHKHKNDWYTINEKLNVAERRISLMDSLDLLEKKGK